MPRIGPYVDSPGRIRSEGQQIDAKLVKTGPSTARISWNIPTPSVGCDVDTQAYNGVVVIFDTTPATVDKTPVDTVKYTADPTADSNLHAGDKIGTGLVIAALYGDKSTTSVDISDLPSSEPCYVSIYAVDKQCRYHRDGAHAYSQDWGGDATESQPGFQEIQIGFEPMFDLFDIANLGTGSSTGIRETDPTGLDPLLNYVIALKIDGCAPDDRDTITFPGSDAQTYQELVNTVNLQFSLLDSPFQGIEPPNTGAYYYSASTMQLFQWSGYEHIELNHFYSDFNPITVDYWYDIENDTLQLTGASPSNQTFFKYHKDPVTELTPADFWFNGTVGYRWEGNTWCEKVSFAQEVDPSLPVTPADGTYWYNPDDGYVYKWKFDCQQWEIVDVIYTETDPNLIADGDYWFDDNDSVLYERVAGAWVEYASRYEVSETEPTTPAPDTAWMNPTTDELKIWDGVVWNLNPVVIFHEDPTNRTTCQLWWDSDDDILYIWDIVNSVWEVVDAFIQSTVAPNATPVLELCTVWYVPSTDNFYTWDGAEWIEQTFINYTTNPNEPTMGDHWNNTTTGKWYRWAASPGAWIEITSVIENSDSPYAPPLNSYWYNFATSDLSQWNGASWIPLAYSVTPLTPVMGDLFFDTNTNTLYEWNGSTYELAILDATMIISFNGNLVIHSGTVGSQSLIIITDESLFDALAEPINVKDPIIGTDGVAGVQGHAQLGVGTDGSSDERRQLILNIEHRLGYPVVNVELTREQLDQCLRLSLEEFRRYSSSAYKRSFFFLNIRPGQQIYTLSDQTVGFHKISNVLGAYRFQSSFLGTATAQGAYGQAMLQHLYQMGSFDLLSYHIISDYVELMNILFAAYLNFTWDEDTRRLFFHQTFGSDERVLMDTMIERTEQELMRDRICKTWIENFALAKAQLMLVEIRGKYATLPGAGGGVSLNAQDLKMAADATIEQCYQEIEQFIANEPEKLGINDFLLG